LKIMEDRKATYMELKPEFDKEFAAKARREKIAAEAQAKADRVTAMANRATDLAAKLNTKNTECASDATSSACTTATAAWATVNDLEKADTQLNLELAFIDSRIAMYELRDKKTSLDTRIGVLEEEVKTHNTMLEMIEE